MVDQYAARIVKKLEISLAYCYLGLYSRISDINKDSHRMNLTSEKEMIKDE